MLVEITTKMFVLSMDVLYLHTIINQINFMRRILSFAAMAAILVLGASCEGTEPENGDNGSNGNNTETPETPTDPVEAVSGDYTGTLNISYKLGADADPISAATGLTNAITISRTTAATLSTAAEPATVDILVKEVTVLNIPVGDVTISGCTVTEADGSYSLSGQTHMDVTVEGNSIPCDIAATGTVKDGKLTLDLVATITLPAANTPAQMVAGTYTGNMIITIDMGTGGTPGDPTALTVEIIESGESTVTMSTSLGELGTIKVEDCTVTANSETGGYDLSGEGAVALDNIGNCEVNFTGTKTGNELKLSITAKPALIPTMTVTVDFTGALSTSSAE